jgi:MFS family permease
MEGAQSKGRWYYAFFPFRVAEGNTSILIPLFIEQVLQGGVSMVGVIAAVTSLASVPASTFWGVLSDRYKRRKIFIIIGFLGSGIPFLLMGLTQNVSQFLVLSLLLGFFTIASAPVSSVLIMETTPKQEWEEAFAIFNKIGGWGWVAGLLCGSAYFALLRGWVSDVVTMRGLFFLIGALAVFSALWAYWWIQEPQTMVSRKDYYRVTGKRFFAHTVIERVRFLPKIRHNILRMQHIRELQGKMSKPLQWFLVANFFLFLSFVLFYTPLPLYLKEQLAIPKSFIFVIYITKSVISAATFHPASRWIKPIGNKWAMLGASLIRVPIFALFVMASFFTSQYVAITFLAVLNGLAGFSWAIISLSSSVLMADLSPEGLEGEVVGIQKTVIGVASILGALLGGYLAEWVGYGSTFVIATMLLLLGASLMTKIEEKEEPV